MSTPETYTLASQIRDALAAGYSVTLAGEIPGRVRTVKLNDSDGLIGYDTPVRPGSRRTVRGGFGLKYLTGATVELDDAEEAMVVTLPSKTPAPQFRNLRHFLETKAEELHPDDPNWPDSMYYKEDTNPDAHPDTAPIPGRHGDLQQAWLARGTTYIWRVGVLARIDSNKADYAYLYIGHEREPGRYEFIGVLHWADGENDDPSRSLPRYLRLAQQSSYLLRERD